MRQGATQWFSKQDSAFITEEKREVHACRCSPDVLSMRAAIWLRGLSPGLLASQGLPSGACLSAWPPGVPAAPSPPYSSAADSRACDSDATSSGTA